MFEPGHLHVTHSAFQPSDVSYNIHIRYELSQNTETGTGMRFFIEGEIDGKAFNDEFELHKDKAYNFASEASHITAKHGLPRNTNLHDLHGQYDAMFEDIRHKLDMKSGDPVDLEDFK
ncbi:MAG TPA: DUF5064 family protein [Pseudomonas sp.]|uniref:DUF5064 family protein n=1 Tax=Pseudomonas sp. TaxID=306 RepID=UPI002ED829D7